MKGIQNNTHESFDFEQMTALLECGRLASNAFKKRINRIYINADTESNIGVGSISIEFDRYSIDTYKKDGVK